MSIYPEITPSYGYSCVRQYRTDKLGPTDGDITQRRKRRDTGLFRISCGYSALTAANERTLIEFFDARHGDFEAFTFYDFVARVYPTETIEASADGSQKTWTLGYRDVTDETVYFDDVAQTSGYSISSRTGTDGQDQLVFTSEPSATVAITMKLTGHIRINNCTFNAAALDAAIINWQRHAVGNILIGQNSE